VGLHHVGHLHYLLLLLGAQRVLYGKNLFRYTIAGRSIPFFAFLMAATAASFSGWTFIGHPGLIWRDGLAYAFASFYVLTIPITGTFFSKRTWLMGKRYGFITPGDMYAYYFNTEAVRWLLVAYGISLLYFLFRGTADGLCGLFNVIAGVPVTFGAIFMAFIVWFYVCTGGLKASTWVGVIQFILLVGGIVILGAYVVTWNSSAAGRFFGIGSRAGPSCWKFPG
jgi:SSS family solute:Na+ symporter